MENKNSIICALSGGLMYIATTAILPDWNHLLVALLAGVVMLIAYYCLLPKRLKLVPRLMLSVAITIVVAAVVRLML